jgi:hypothetical protein
MKQIKREEYKEALERINDEETRNKQRRREERRYRKTLRIRSSGKN